MSFISEVMDQVIAKNPAESEFHHAVRFYQAFMKKLFYHIGGDIGAGRREFGYLLG